jgi:hypothetical protein
MERSFNFPTLLMTRRLSQSSHLIQRVYEQWPGSNTFFCKGRCITGPIQSEWRARLALILVVVIISTAFFAKEAKSLWDISKSMILLPAFLELVFFVSLIRYQFLK